MILQAVWLVSFIGTVLLDVDLGLLVGVIFALSTVIFRSQRSVLKLPLSVCVLVHISNIFVYLKIHFTSQIAKQFIYLIFTSFKLFVVLKFYLTLRFFVSSFCLLILFKYSFALNFRLFFILLIESWAELRTLLVLFFSLINCVLVWTISVSVL